MNMKKYEMMFIVKATMESDAVKAKAAEEKEKIQNSRAANAANGLNTAVNNARTVTNNAANKK